MPRKKFRVDTLKRPRIRQSWHPVNLYNLSRQELQFTRERTFFQQKWTAKSLTRPYHGEQIREGQWELQFSRRIPAVVPMDAAVLAKSDGSDMAAGRGSGKEEKGSASRSLPKSTPYMSMAFFPQERRLDTCIFRALFASSIRQARNMVSHGHVKVNGKKLIYPGYLLNPGDMFSVDPEMVMYCTGQNPRMRTIKHRLTHYGPGKKAIVEAYRAPFFALLRSVSSLSRVYQPRPDANKQLLKELQALRDEMTPFNFGPDTAPEAVYTPWKTRFDSIRAREPLFTEEFIKAAFIFDSILLRLSKQIERAERNKARNLKSQPPPPTDSFKPTETAPQPLLQETLDDLLRLRTSITTALSSPLSIPLALSFRDTYRTLLTPTARQGAASSLPDTLLDPLFRPPAILDKPIVGAAAPLTPHLRSLAAMDWPWTSKDWMSAFAFIPRYLEVNQNVCSAVYLRDPVARPGIAEVPSPFAPETLGLAFQWYLRRR